MEKFVSRVIKWIILAYLINYFFIQRPTMNLKNVKSLKNMNLIKNDKEILYKNGTLIEEGYLKHNDQIFIYNNLYPVFIGITLFKSLRYKKLENFFIRADNHIILLNIFDAKIYANIQIILYDLEKHTVFEKEYKKYTREFGIKKNEDDNNYEFEINDDADRFDIIFEKKNGLNNKLKFDFRELNLKADIDFNKENDQESITINQKISEDLKYFMNKKIEGNLRCKGNINLNKNNLINKKCLVAKSLTRGIFEFKTKYIGSLFIDENEKGDLLTFSLETGIGHIDSSTPTDFLILNKKVLPLEPVEIKYDSLNFNNGMTFKTFDSLKHEDQNTNLIFRTNKYKKLTKSLIIFKDETEIAFGNIEGEIIENNNNKISINSKGIFYSLLHQF